MKSRLPLLLGALLALGLLGALLVQMIPSKPRRTAVTPNVALPVVTPAPTVAPKIETAAAPAATARLDPTAPAASPIPAQPAEPAASLPEERKNHPKVAKSRPVKAKTSAGQVPQGAPARVVDEPWR